MFNSSINIFEDDLVNQPILTPRATVAGFKANFALEQWRTVSSGFYETIFESTAWLSEFTIQEFSTHTTKNSLSASFPTKRARTKRLLKTELTFQTSLTKTLISRLKFKTV